MGVQIAILLNDCRKQINLMKLKGRTIGFDAFNVIYAILSSIRNKSDGGNLFTDTSGNITSHLIGLFPRMLNLLTYDIKPVFIFDGKPPDMKKTTVATRRKIKEDALEKQKVAIEAGDLESAYKYSRMTTKITKQIVDDSKTLLTAMGIPYVQAPSEADPQGAYMVRKKQIFAYSSQDYDSFLFGSPLVIRNLAMVSRDKRSSVVTEGEIIKLKDVYSELGIINQKQLVLMGLLMGTDYNPGGLERIGPKTALKLVKQFPDQKSLFAHLSTKYNLEEDFPVDPDQIIDFFINPPIDKTPELQFTRINHEKIMKFMVDERDFASKNIATQLKRLTERKRKIKKDQAQKSLDKFFG